MFLACGLLADASDMITTTDWVDEKSPAIKVNYNENTQKLEFTVDRTVLGTGTESNFNSFSIFGSTTAESTNNLGHSYSGRCDN